METSPQEIRHQIAQYPAEEAQQKRFTQWQYAAAGQCGDGEQHNGAGDDDAGNRQALDERDDENRRAEPRGVGA